MQQKNEKKTIKTFPLELEEHLHKSLKVKAIEEDKTLHSLIVDTLRSLVQHKPATHNEPKEEGLGIK